MKKIICFLFSIFLCVFSFYPFFPVFAEELDVATSEDIYIAPQDNANEAKNASEPKELESRLHVNEDGLTHIGVSPYDQYLNLNPGEHYDGSFKILNSGAFDIDWTLETVPYHVNGSDYLPDFVSETSTSQISKWISFDVSRGSLTSGGIMELKYHIDVPYDVQVGGQYAAITVSAVAKNRGDNPDASFSISMSVNAAMIIYANILGGETRVDYQILENKITPFILSGPVTASSLLGNTGNTHLNASYQLEVYPIFSDEPYYYNYDEDDEKSNIRVLLPDTERMVLQTWDQTPQVGIYRVVQRIFVGEDVSEVEQIVVKCPIWLLSIIILFFVLLIIYIIVKIRKRKTVQA